MLERTLYRFEINSCVNTYTNMLVRALLRTNRKNCGYEKHTINRSRALRWPHYIVWFA